VTKYDQIEMMKRWQTKRVLSELVMKEDRKCERLRIMKNVLKVTATATWTGNSKRILVLPLLMLFHLSSLFGQTIQGVNEPKFQSPNAAALGKFGDTPVGYHTGVPEISVPIFTVQEGDLSVPISLAYHSNGIKVDEVASHVGLGWSLIAGGSIARTIMGGPDEGKSTTYQINSTCGIKGWYRDYGMPSCLNLNPTDCPNVGHYMGSPVDPGSGRGAGLEYTCYNIYMAAASGTIDTEPDLYSYSVPGHSGKFLFDANRKAHLIPEDDVFIKPEESPVLFNTWKIIATDGTKYFFGGSNATETSYSDAGRVLSPTPDNRSSTTWYLTKMESANGEHWIKFDYEAEQSSYCTKATQTYIRSTVDQKGEYWAANGVTIASTDGRRLRTITTSSNHTTVVFESEVLREDLTAYLYGSSNNTSAKSLSRIKVTYGSNDKIFTLNTGYFEDTGPNEYAITPAYTPETKRLKLLSVQEATLDNSIVLPPYTFAYDESMELPRRGSFSQDHWGYYNGKPNTVLLPPFTDPVNGQQRPGADRASDFAFMKVGVLTRVTYPTGGFTEFTYEPHKETPASTQIIGGLRIASMVDNDGQGGTITKNYSYPQGILYTGQLSYVQYPGLNQHVANGSSWNIYDFGVIFSSAPNPAMQSSQGYHIGYSMVEVSSPGNGKSVYKYHNTYPFIPSNTLYPRTPNVAVIGTSSLFSEEHYNEAGSVLKSTTYNYGTTGGNVLISGKKILAVSPQNTSASPQYPYPMWNDYSITTYRHHLMQKFENVDGVSITTNYTYDANNKHNFPVAEEFTGSDGVLRRTESIYPGDAGSGAPAIMYDSTKPGFKNLLGTAIEQKKLTQGTLTSRAVNQYADVQGRLLLTKSTSFPTGTSLSNETIYEYDGVCNPVVIKKADGVNVSYLWGYGNKYPIAEIRNATIPAIQPITVSSGTAITGNVSSCTTLANAITIDFPQTVLFTVNVTLSGATGLSTTLTLKSGSTIYFGPKVYTASGTYSETVVLPVGTYQYCYQSAGFPGGYSGYSSINATSNVQANIVNPVAAHTSFEENGIADASPKTGSKVWSGTYSVKMPGVIGSYRLSYWKKQNVTNAQWQLIDSPISITGSSTPDVVIGEAGYLIDEVRLLPAAAQMTTYTYDPGVGILSSTDSNNVTSYYQYDKFGRLQAIKDNKGNLLRSMRYNYKRAVTGN
jgi:YD repeat-containing protein